MILACTSLHNAHTCIFEPSISVYDFHNNRFLDEKYYLSVWLSGGFFVVVFGLFEGFLFTFFFFFSFFYFHSLVLKCLLVLFVICKQNWNLIWNEDFRVNNHQTGCFLWELKTSTRVRALSPTTGKLLTHVSVKKSLPLRL